MSEKTCGNCELRNSGYMMCRSKPYLSEGCGFWNESRASLEQRYEQLEHVAKKMIGAIDPEIYEQGEIEGKRAVRAGRIDQNETHALDVAQEERNRG